MNNTPSYEQAPKGIERTAEQAAEIREQQRLDAVDKLTGEGLELDPDDAYDAYLDFVESIRESARAGELVTSAQPEPFTEEQILRQYIDAFDIQRGAGDISGIRLIPGAHNLRKASLALLGSMAPGSEPSPHAAFIEGMMREAYNNVTHPEAAMLTGVEAEAPFEESMPEELPAEEVSFTAEANEAPEQNSAEVQDAGVAEQEIGMQHERQVQSMAEQTAESLATLTGRVAEYEQAGRLSVSAVTAAEDELSTMSQQLARFEDYGPDGARTMLV